MTRDDCENCNLEDSYFIMASIVINGEVIYDVLTICPLDRRVREGSFISTPSGMKLITEEDQVITDV